MFLVAFFFFYFGYMKLLIYPALSSGEIALAFIIVAADVMRGHIAASWQDRIQKENGFISSLRFPTPWLAQYQSKIARFSSTFFLNEIYALFSQIFILS
jgi:hypothetical protein